MIARFFADRRRFFASKAWWSFLLCVSAERYLVFLTTASLWLCVAPIGESRAGMIYVPTLWILTKSILLVPLIETVVFQCLVVETTRRLKWPASWQLLASLLAFAVSHFIGGGMTHGLLSGAVGGYYLAFTYVIFRERSLRWAIGMTLGFHALHNALTAVERAVRYS